MYIFFFSKGKTPTKTIKPFPIFTGQTMVLMCEVSPELNIGAISGSKWKFNGKEINTNQVLLSGSTSTLTVNNVALLDIGKSQLAEVVN